MKITLLTNPYNPTDNNFQFWSIQYNTPNITLISIKLSSLHRNLL